METRTQSAVPDEPINEAGDSSAIQLIELQKRINELRSQAIRELSEKREVHQKAIEQLDQQLDEIRGPETRHVVKTTPKVQSIGRPRKLTAAGRKAIADAQRKRWAGVKKAAKKR